MRKRLQFWRELKRRKVFRVLAMYAASAFIVLEAVDIIAPSLGLPDWTLKFVIILIIIGFPFVAIISWIFDITPDGLMKTVPRNETTKQDIQVLPAKRLFSLNNIVIAMLVVVVLILGYPKIFNRGKASSGKVEGRNEVIAILPFMNNTGDESYDHWKYGISELLINALSTSNMLTLIDNQTINEVVADIEGIQTASVGPEIAREVASRARVNSYINGNYLLAGSTFRINLKLIDAKNNKVLRTEYVEGRADSIFSMIGSLANAIKGYLEIADIGERTTFETADYLTTSSPEAYRYFIRGMEAMWAGRRVEGSGLRKAIEIDSSFTSAYFYQSLWWSSVGYYVGAKQFLLKAYEGKNRLPEKMQFWLEAFKSLYIDKDLQVSINYLKQVSALDPLSRLNWLWLGWIYMQIDNYDDALLSFEQILKLNKQLGSWKNQIFYAHLGTVYQKQEEYNRAQRTFKEGLQHFHEPSLIFYSQAVCALLQNDTSSANHYISQYKSAARNNLKFPEIQTTAYVGNIYNDAGQIKKAEDLYRLALSMRLKEGRPSLDSIHPGNHLLWYYQVLGKFLVENNINVEEGMEFLQIALDLSQATPGFSDHPKILSGLGYGYYLQGRYEEALQFLKRAEEGTVMYDHHLHQLIQEVEIALADQNI